MIALCFFAMETYGQSCSGPVPADATVVTSEINTVDNGTYWICDGGDVDALSPNGGQYFVEFGGRLELIGNGHTVYVNSGGIVEVVGNDNILYVAGGARAQVNGNANLIYRAAKANVTDGGMDNTLDESCLSVFIDYTNAPPNVCVTTSVAHAEDRTSTGVSVLTLHDGIFEVVVQDCRENMEGTVEALNAEGAAIVRELVSGCRFTVDLSQQTNGVYWLLYRTSTHVVSRRVLVVH